MDKAWVYEIQVEGTLAGRWTDWFEGLAIEINAAGNTTLSGSLIDQAALFGVLNKIHSLNLILISVSRSILLEDDMNKS